MKSLLWLAASFALTLVAAPAGAFPGGLADWQARYGAISPSGDDAGCQLCHANASGGRPWNAYGWDIKLALDDDPPSCDLDNNGVLNNTEAFICIEAVDSDGAGGDNATEIGLGTQPGWTLGANNTLFDIAGSTPGQTAPTNIGQLDPDGSEPPPPPPPPPPTNDDGKPKKLKKKITVKPGDSIQDAIDRILPGGTIYVKPGIYRETADATNALNIDKNGVKLIGLKASGKSSDKSSKKASKKKKAKFDRVIIQNAGNQRNGIVVVPPERTDCMSCHTDMAPPFPLAEGVPSGFPKEQDPWLYGVEIRGITIQGFRNNGLFTEHVDGFKIVDVHSVDNKNYGIFPTLSRNGIITQSSATGADDSGIWVETSENVEVTHNVVSSNVNGFELSNSDDVLFANNEVRGNSVGFAVLLLPDIFDDRAGANRITVRNNTIIGNNKPNTARPDSVLGFVPRGIGILWLGVDNSVIEGNWISDNDFAGIAFTDYCLAVLGTPFSCERDQNVTPEFFLDQNSANNRTLGNTFVDNGLNPDSHPFDFAASDMALVTFSDWGNCFEGNVFGSFFRFFGFGGPPACD